MDIDGQVQLAVKNPDLSQCTQQNLFWISSGFVLKNAAQAGMLTVASNAVGGLLNSN
ncbi:hypothetical protein [Thiorhodospira sibirica]|uniref:hypothetical protein n=1 Tax=Thiorhodospira sibirica TaxID=154347 RepID=UPI0002DBCB5C|nr:hypothetical protein [Thiorhodospira sibirica]